MTKSAVIVSFDNIKVWQTIKFRLLPKFVILSVSEVSKNGKFSFNLCGFFATLKMTKSAVFTKTARNDAFAVILSDSEVSKNSKFSFNVCGFFCCGLRLATRWVAFLQRLKMTKRAQKPKNKAFKKFSVPKSASNEREREREREVPRPNTAPFSLYLKALR